jgi:UDP-N-acetyl-D-glucosamine dehydrogenase
MPFYPGPGLGGHCIPIDPFYLSWKARQSGFEARFIELAGQVNGSMPHFVVDKVTEALNVRKKPVNGSTVIVAGLTYKRDIDDVRESPALDVLGLLHDLGARVRYADPYVATLDAREWAGGETLSAVALTPAALREADCVVVVTDHTAFDYAAIVEHADVVVDTRNAIKDGQAPRARAGVEELAGTRG